jgi:uncharacterized repeat protein (TIGR01451 family)
MSVFSFFSFSPRTRKAANSRRKANAALHASLRVEALEDRSLPSGVTISGFVYNDVNNNGLFETGETPIGNNPIELHNSSGVVVGSTTTDGNGFYQFKTDATIDQTPQTLTKTVAFPSTATNFSLQGLLDQFDPSLGALQEIDMTHAGSITSDIKVENTSTSSGSIINGTVAGDLTLQAPGGVNDKLSLSQYAGTFNAQVYDQSLDFAGASGSDFGQKTANGSDSIVLTGSQMTPFIGTGQVQVTESAEATSTAGGGGNVVVNVVSTGLANITVVYKYVPDNSLKPGTYTIVETQEPPGYFPGKNSQNGVILNTPPGTEVIPVTITTGDSPNNDFGKLRASSLAGTVYFDANDNGQLDSGEPGISGVTLTLTGTDVTGAAIHQTTTTDTNGNYKFDTLQQGTYTVTETPPAGYLDGAATAGSVGGSAGVEMISNVNMPPNTDAVNYNFGELKGGSLSGFVYLDGNNNGVMDAGESGIPGATVTLTGTDDHGNAVSATTTTDQTGAYQFTGLRAGTYTITEMVQAGYDEGSTNVGSLGGTPANDVISLIKVGMGQAGEQYNFGEKPPPNSDVGIVKTASAPVSNYGDQLQYTLAVTNYGAGVAQGVVVNDLLPADETFVSSWGDGWSVWEQNGTLTAWRDSLAVGQTSDILVTVIVPSKTESLTNFAQVSTTTPDNNPSNNTTTVTTQVQGPPGNPTPGPVPPLVIKAEGIPVVGKNFLMNDNGTQFIDPGELGKFALVQGVYQTLTGAPADAATALLTVKGMYDGTTTPDLLVANVWNSDAHWALQAQQLYQTYLGRSPTAAESGAVVQALQSGATTQSQALAILASPEFQALHPTSAGLASALSQAIIGQTPDVLTEQSLVQSMGAETLYGEITALLNSTDGVNRAVDQTCRDTLRRDATAAELALYTPQIQAGTLTTDQLAQRLLASQEFYQLAYNSVQ